MRTDGVLPPLDVEGPPGQPRSEDSSASSSIPHADVLDTGSLDEIDSPVGLSSRPASCAEALKPHAHAVEKGDWQVENQKGLHRRRGARIQAYGA